MITQPIIISFWANPLQALQRGHHMWMSPNLGALPFFLCRTSSRVASRLRGGTKDVTGANDAAANLADDGRSYESPRAHVRTLSEHTTQCLVECKVSAKTERWA